MQFSDLKLIDPLLRAVAAEGYDTPTPIQQKGIPPILAGHDLLACAQTGTGKTAAFALPILQRLAGSAPPEGRSRPIRALVLTPTRELAAQIGDSFTAYGRHLGLRNTVIFGGVGKGAQIAALRRGLDVMVATPGRLLDLASDGAVNLSRLEVLVLDEADRMLDMGFIHDVKRVIALLPQKRQTLFFSATMPPDVRDLAERILVNPERIAVAPVATTAERIEQSVYFVERTDKRALLEHVLQDQTIRRAIVFTRTKHGANRVADQLSRASIGAAAIHGNKSQNARERALADFKRGATRVLVATDIAARGIDIDDISHVINYDLPNIPESYVHRIGRTARAGASGVALSFCDQEERAFLTDIERLIRMRVPVVEDHPYRSQISAAAPARSFAPDRGPGPGSRPSGPPGHGRRPQQGGGGPPRHQGSPGPRPQHGGPRPQSAGPRPQHGGPRPQHGSPRPQAQGSASSSPRSSDDASASQGSAQPRGRRMSFRPPV
ncbi:DEAD/DEAH box helicase [Chondromyces apiculatus]|uniref:DEAD-box ATP-dependent RNA helicase RhpA n=1 Tax=Chondromyces apiculatus DSM 436 TaxID=1192034 RepID=A0A017T427_9BACT|nr:DEAD/DEAH box helicase [Chondromyces apiculatus]EYF03757.1 ATP-dependent RNA helicase RhlE [Chondromyces apiculatus DSM 436]